MRRACRRDANAAEIVGALQAIGVVVFDGQRHGDGWPDLLAVRDRRYVALEVKAKTGKLRESQVKFRAAWELTGGEYYVVRTVDAALAIFGVR